MVRGSSKTVGGRRKETEDITILSLIHISESDDGVEYDENGDPVDNAGASDDVEYDEYGNVIDSDNTAVSYTHLMRKTRNIWDILRKSVAGLPERKI